MTGLKIDFTGDKARLMTDETVTGLEASAQNTLLHFGQSVNSDAIFPERGSSLALAAFRGRIFGTADARHESNFAAVKAQEFNNEHTDEDDAGYISKLTLSVVKLVKGSASPLLEVSLQLVAPDQTQYGSTSNL